MTLLNLGPVQWRCTNGRPNYRTSWWVRPFFWTTTTLHGLPIYPAVEFTPWHKGLPSEDLGQFSHSLSIHIEFWKWTVGFMVGRTSNVLTEVEIKKRRNEG